MALIDKFAKLAKDNIFKVSSQPVKYFDKIALMNKQSSETANKISSATINKINQQEQNKR
jgi:hypothetical protein